MSRFATITALSLFFVFGAPHAFAATAPTLSVIESSPRVLVLRYNNIPEHSTLTVRNAKNEVVRSDITLPDEGGRKTIRIREELPQGTYTVRAVDRENTILASATFSIEVPQPTCRITANKKHVERGDVVTLKWSSQYATNGLLFGSKAVAASGTERIALYHAGARGFALNLFGKGGLGSCSTKVTVSE